MTLAEFQADIRAGIPAELPALQPYDTTINHAPKRKDILTPEEKKLALRNALRYFPKELHAQLAPEFAEELRQLGVASSALMSRNVERYDSSAAERLERLVKRCGFLSFNVHYIPPRFGKNKSHGNSSVTVRSFE